MKAIIKVASALEPRKHEELLIQLVKKLTNSELDGPKAVACALIPGIYQSIIICEYVLIF